MQRRLLVLGSVALGGLVAVRAEAATSVTKGPYLQHLSSTGVEIRVELGSAAPASVEIEHPGQPKRTESDPIGTAFQVLRFSALTPATRYRYTVRVGRDQVGSGEFVTAPADDSSAPASFVLYGDDRTDHAAHAAVVRAIEREPFDFLVHTGDFVQQGGVDEYWQQFFDIERTLLADHCVFACIGNHELFEDNSAAHYERFFGAASEADGPPYGTFRWGRMRFFLLNAFESWTGPERSWLDSALSSADSEPDLDWRIAVIHHSPWSAGPHGDNKRLLQAHVDDLLVHHHVDLVLAGHDHIYERGEAKGLKYVISGGGGAPLYTDLSPEPSTRKVESAFHYVLFSVNGDRLTETAKRVDGSIIETCGFVRGGDWDCDGKRTPPATAAPAPPAVPTPSSAARCGCTTPGTSRGGALFVAPLALGLLALRRSRRKCRRERRAL